MSEEGNDVKLKLKQVVKYGGHSVGANGSVNVTFLAAYGEIVHSIETLQMLNCDVTIGAKIPGKSAMRLGVFRVKQVVFDGDGESRIKLNGLSDFIEMDALNRLPLKTDDVPEFKVQYQATIEKEKEDDESGEDESDV